LYKMHVVLTLILIIYSYLINKVVIIFHLTKIIIGLYLPSLLQKKYILEKFHWKNYDIIIMIIIIILIIIIIILLLLLLLLLFSSKQIYVRYIKWLTWAGVIRGHINCSRTAYVNVYTLLKKRNLRK